MVTTPFNIIKLILQPNKSNYCFILLLHKFSLSGPKMTPQIFTTKTLLDKSLKFRSLYYLSCVASLLGYSLRLPQYMRYLDRINPFKPMFRFYTPPKKLTNKGSLPNFSSLVNYFMTEVPIIYKSVHWFALQINGLISIW